MDTYNFENEFRMIFQNDKISRQKKNILLQSKKLGLYSIMLSYPFLFALIVFGNGNGLSNYQSIFCIAATFVSLPLWSAAGMKQRAWRIM